MDAGLLNGKNFSYQRSQDTSPCISSSIDTTAPSTITSNFLSFRESKVAIGIRQAEWEKQMESMDQKQAELFHFQWSLIREQLGTLTQGLGVVRQECETFRGGEARREVREADFARVVRELQADIERESSARRKESEEVVNALSQLKQALELERSERTHAMQAMETQVNLQFKNVKLQQQQHLDADKDLSSRFDHWCMELRATLDKESSTRGQKLEEMEREMVKMGQRLEKETRDRVQAFDDVSGMSKGSASQVQKIDELGRELQKISQRVEKENRDRTDAIDDLTSMQKAAGVDLERESSLRKKESEELQRSTSQLRQAIDKASASQSQKIDNEAQKIDDLQRSITQLRQSTDKDIRERLREALREVEESFSRGMQEERRRLEAMVRGLEAQVQEERRRLEAMVRGLEAQAQETSEEHRRLEGTVRTLGERVSPLPTAIDCERAERSACVERLERWLEDALANAMANVDARAAELADKQTLLSKKAEDLAKRTIDFDELHRKHDEDQTAFLRRLEDFHEALDAALSQLGPESEARALQVVTSFLEQTQLVPKIEFQQAIQRVWEALDTHTHDVDVAAMQQHQLQAVQVRRIVRQPSPPAPPSRSVVSAQQVQRSVSPVLRYSATPPASPVATELRATSSELSAVNTMNVLPHAGAAPQRASPMLNQRHTLQVARSPSMPSLPSSVLVSPGLSVANIPAAGSEHSASQLVAPPIVAGTAPHPAQSQFVASTPLTPPATMTLPVGGQSAGRQ